MILAALRGEGSAAPAPALPDALALIVRAVLDKGDLAHLALFLWALAATVLLFMTLRDLASANRRFDLFVRELARFNRTMRGGER